MQMVVIGYIPRHSGGILSLGRWFLFVSLLVCLFFVCWSFEGLCIFHSRWFPGLWLVDEIVGSFYNRLLVKICHWTIVTNIIPLSYLHAPEVDYRSMLALTLDKTPKKQGMLLIDNQLLVCTDVINEMMLFTIRIVPQDPMLDDWTDAEDRRLGSNMVRSPQPPLPAASV